MNKKDSKKYERNHDEKFFTAIKHIMRDEWEDFTRKKTFRWNKLKGQSETLHSKGGGHEHDHYLEWLLRRELDHM